MPSEGKLEVLITLVTEATQEGAVVVVRGTGFRGTALWRGEALEAGAQIDAELQVRDEVHWESIVVMNEGSPITSGNDAGGVLQGLVEDVDKDGVLVLRCPDEIVFVETTGNPPLGIVGRAVHFEVRDVELVPTNY